MGLTITFSLMRRANCVLAAPAFTSKSDDRSVLSNSAQPPNLLLRGFVS
jgi:hypothetical protein